MSDRDAISPGQDTAVLRAELARVREEARQALAQLRGELDAVRESQDALRDVDSVTEQIALQQELDTIRSTLREKERQVDATGAQCRRLEDALEDQHLAYDGLKQDLERKKLSLAAAREQTVRVSRERHEVDERYLALLSSEQEGAPAAEAEDPHAARARGFSARLVGGLTAAVLLGAVALAVWLQLDPQSVPDNQSPGGRTVGPPDATAPQTGPGDTISTDHEDQSPVAGEEGPDPVVLGTVRDRLGDGTPGPPMLALRGGELTIGKLRALPNDDEGPAHDVRLEGFLIGTTEVTFEEYDRFARATGRRLPGDSGWGRGRRPVVDVSWEDARAYANWLSRQTGQGYRLPSEAEWEYAAAAGQRRAFWWGYRPGQNRAVCFNCGSRWDNRSTAPVGTFDPNPFGLYDTAGNAMEWVADCYRPNYIGAALDGRPWGGENCRFRVARGGAFNKPARSMRTTTRHRFAPDTRINALGFRLARDE